MLSRSRTVCPWTKSPWTMRPLEDVSLGQCVPWTMRLLDNASLTVPETLGQTDLKLGYVWPDCRGAAAVQGQDASVSDGTSKLRHGQVKRRPRAASSKGRIVRGTVRDFSFGDSSVGDTLSRHIAFLAANIFQLPIIHSLILMVSGKKIWVVSFWEIEHLYMPMLSSLKDCFVYIWGPINLYMDQLPICTDTKAFVCFSLNWPTEVFSGNSCISAHPTLSGCMVHNVDSDSGVLGARPLVQAR